MAKFVQNLSIDGMTSKQCLVIAIEAIKELGWRIRDTSDAGVIAYTENGVNSWNGEVTFKLEHDTASVECVTISNVPDDFGHNQTAVLQFVDEFEKMRPAFTMQEIENLYDNYKKDFLPPYEDTLKPYKRPEFVPVNSFWSYFIPNKTYFVTPILIITNILIFVVMVCSGVSFFEPATQSMLNWGANSTVTTLDGQWWRLLSNCFIHFGLVHLLLNMYALAFVGILLEPFLGRLKFLSAYLLTGIIASLASLWWHDYTVSAGASGAIFGMYGVFLAILSTNQIERNLRNGLLANIGIFVVYNLIYGGVKGGIDNAAHIGGLLSGIVIGFTFVPGLSKPDNKRLNQLMLAGTVAVMLICCVVTYISLSGSDRVVYYKQMEGFYKIEDKALKILQEPDNKTDGQILYGLNDGINGWKNGLALVQGLDKLKLSTKIHKRNKILEQYCVLRGQSYQLMYNAVKNKNQVDSPALKTINEQIKKTLDNLTSL